MTYEQLSGCCGMSVLELGELVGYSALVPVNGLGAQQDTKNSDHWVFSVQWLKPLRAASKMRSDFDLDLFTVAIVLGNFLRIDELEQSVLNIQLKMHRMMQPCADVSAPFEREDGAQLDLFFKETRRFEID